MPRTYRVCNITHQTTWALFYLTVKNLLDLSTLEPKEICSFENISLPQLLSTVLSEFKEIMQADKEKLRRMFINLIDNAIREP